MIFQFFKIKNLTILKFEHKQMYVYLLKTTERIEARKVQKDVKLYREANFANLYSDI